MMPSMQIEPLLDAARATMRRGVGYLLGRQKPEGFWEADLTADSTLESDFILLELWRHAPVDGVWNPPTRPLIEKAVRSILDRQLPDGGFNIYANGPSELSATVKAYTALKLAGLDYDDPHFGSGSGADFSAGRRARGQQLRQDQPEFVRAVSARVCAFDSP